MTMVYHLPCTDVHYVRFSHAAANNTTQTQSKTKGLPVREGREVGWPARWTEEPMSANGDDVRECGGGRAFSSSTALLRQL